jgi:hypothetical protein
MPAAFFVVRAAVAENLREKFNPWTSTDHLPRDVVTLVEEREEM